MQQSDELDLLLDEYRRSLTDEVIPDSLENDLLRKMHEMKQNRTSRVWILAAVLVLCVITGFLFRLQQSVKIEPGLATIKTEPRKQKEIVTAFIPLYDNQALTPTRMVRVRLNGDALRQLGLSFGQEQSAADGLIADVVLSEEGLPQAIRFVQNNSSSKQ